MSDLRKVFGIDLGTTNSAVARIDEFDRAVIVPNDINEPTTPSVIYFESTTNVVVGEEAKNMAEVEPEAVVQFVKRFMGRKDQFAFVYENKRYSPEELSAIILRGLVEKAQQNVNEKISDVVITVPAYFDEARRVATKNAGVMAELNVLDIVNEPIAAALAYGVQSEQRRDPEGSNAGKALVFDLGGGTFDVTVIDMQNNDILVTGGRQELGGKDWDDRLITYLANEFERQFGTNPLMNPNAHQEIRMKSEAAKKRLTFKTKDVVTFSYSGQHCRVEIEREKFEEITEDLLNETIHATKETIAQLQKKVGKENSEIRRILLVGGSSRMPKVKSTLENELGVECEIHDPDECVAKGAAIWAVRRRIDNLAHDVGYDVQTGEGNKDAFDKVLETQIETVRNRNFYLALPGRSGNNVSSHTYGILAYDDGTAIVAPFLQKNEPIPFVYESPDGLFGTEAENQASIELVLMEADGESVDPGNCQEIGRGTVELPPGVPKGSEVRIRFNYAADGTMSLGAEEVTSGQQCEVRIAREGVLAAEEISEARQGIALLKTR